MKTLISFYISFELTLLPISIFIIGWGYQPERLKAFKYIFMYTVRASLPLLFILIMLKAFFIDSFRASYIMPLKSVLRGVVLSRAGDLFLTLGFLVKFPIYGVHLWLPKAHVEAPIGGSIILAGLLLKLGGFGMMLLTPFLSSNFYCSLISCFRGLGGVVISVICLRQVDMKVLIAYSSVSHLRIRVIGILRKSPMLLLRAFIILISHGVTSPGIFLGAHLMYLRSHSRNMLINSRILNFRPIFSLI